MDDGKHALVMVLGLLSAVAAPLASTQTIKDCTPLSLPAERVAPRPTAYAEFCDSHPGQCDMTGPLLIASDMKTLKAMEKINREVNAEFLFTEDLEWRGKEDEWSYPVLGHGDCEDFALEKRRRLVELGLPRAALPLAIVYHKEFMSSHAVLLVETKGGTMVMDSLNDDMPCWDKAPYNYESRERPDSRWDRFDQSLWTWFPRHWRPK